jgi:hypothetical protein
MMTEKIDLKLSIPSIFHEIIIYENTTFLMTALSAVTQAEGLALAQ